MAGSVARAHHSTRSPGETPASLSAAANAAVRPSRVAASTTEVVSQPSIRTGASGRDAHCRAHTSGRVRPSTGAWPSGHRPAGTSALTTGDRRS